MNTLKKCILLMVLTLNLMPYMQDGNVKWSTTETAAQLYYTEEVITAGLVWKCGDESFRDNSSYFFNSYVECESIWYRFDPHIVVGLRITPGLDDLNYSNWCVFNTLSLITGIKSSILACGYYTNFRPDLQSYGCKINVGVKATQLDDYLTYATVSKGGSINDITTLAKAFNEHYGLVKVKKFSDQTMHMMLYRGIIFDASIRFEYQTVYIYDTPKGGHNSTSLDAITFNSENFTVIR
jgi:hypothetical protein